MNVVKRCSGLIVIMSFLVGPSNWGETAEPLVHYRFDTGDIFGSTVLDRGSAAAHGSLIGNVQRGVAGVLDNAIRLPNDDGASYVRIRDFSNPAPNGNDPRTFAYWFSQEAVGDENKMFGYGGGAVGTSFDVSLEGGGVRLRYSGGNVTWGSGFDFTGADAGFHHLAVRVPNGAVDYLDVDVFLDGQPLVGVATGGNPGGTAINTGGGLATEFNIGRSPVFAPGGDFIGLIDDFRIYDEAISDAEILSLASAAQTLTLEVDSTTGSVALHNPTDQPLPFDYYEIASPAGSLVSDSWVPIEAQGLAGFPGGDDNGQGWEALGGAGADFLAEGRLVGESTLAADGWLGLGNLVQPGTPPQLSLVYGLGGVFRTGQVVFAASAAAGDYNRDGVVDQSDYAVWRNNYGSRAVLPGDATPGVIDAIDYAVWREGLIASAQLSNPTPEPFSLWLLGGTGVAGGRRLVSRAAL